jgi:hypothetical protein
MPFDNCPLCGLAVNVGSHWDCVFEMLAEWVAHRAPKQEPVHTGGETGKDEGKNG